MQHAKWAEWAPLVDGLLFAFGLLFRCLKVWNLSEWCNVLQIKVEIKVAKSKSGRGGKSWRFELTLRTGKFRERSVLVCQDIIQLVGRFARLSLSFSFRIIIILIYGLKRAAKLPLWALVCGQKWGQFAALYQAGQNCALL